MSPRAASFLLGSAVRNPNPAGPSRRIMSQVAHPWQPARPPAAIPCARRCAPRAAVPILYLRPAAPHLVQEGCCAFGDHCPYAHNVFEYWLHPTRYRTQLCNDGSNCKRKICFFAHRCGCCASWRYWRVGAAAEAAA